MKRGATIAALRVCGAAGAMVVALLALTQVANANDGTTPPVTTPPVTTEPTPPQPRVITDGVTIGRTLVGGMTPAAARVLLRAQFNRPLVLRGGPGARIIVMPKKLGSSARVDQAVNLAARIKRPGYVIPLNVVVPRARIDRYVATLGKRFRRSPVEAKLRMRNLKPFATRDVPGRRLKEVVTSRAIFLALKTQRREPIDLPFAMSDAKVRSDEFGYAVVIRRGTKKLLLYRVARTSKLVRSFNVATGKPEFPTPIGAFTVTTKQRNPWWYPPPGSAWAKDLKPVPPGLGNPLGTRWMGISSRYVGIHGTPDAASIGYSASHGCIRMLIPEVEWLFNRIEVGTPVFIVAA